MTHMRYQQAYSFKTKWLVAGLLLGVGVMLLDRRESPSVADVTVAPPQQRAFVPRQARIAPAARVASDGVSDATLDDVQDDDRGFATNGFAYGNCAEARAAGAAPIRRGEPGYAPWLDGDNDGIACEPWMGR